MWSTYSEPWQRNSQAGSQKRRVFSYEELDTDTQEDDSKGKSQTRNGIQTPFPCGLERAVTELTDISLGDGSHVPGKDEDSQCKNKTNKQNLYTNKT